jgi:NhaP-type Na+/H+ or K+/H+ antiporter
MATNSTPAQATPAASGLNWKTKSYVIGVLLGIVLGLLSAYLYVRSTEENRGTNPGKIKTGDAMKLVLALLALVRQIADLGNK